MREEKKRILKMLEEGKITSDEAERLLETLENTGADEESGSRKKVKWMKVRVQENGETKVNINLPISLVRALLKITGKFNMRMGKRSMDETLKGYGININNVEDLDKILNEITGDTPYKLVDIEDEGDKVEIYIE